MTLYKRGENYWIDFYIEGRRKRKMVGPNLRMASWYYIVGSHDPQHLKAGISISGFDFRKGPENFLLKRILPLTADVDFQYGVFGSLALKIRSWI